MHEKHREAAAVEGRPASERERQAAGQWCMAWVSSVETHAEEPQQLHTPRKKVSAAEADI